MSLEKELHELANRACDGKITPEERDRLEALLRDQPQHRHVYLRYVNLHAFLTWQYRTGSNSNDPPAEIPASSREVEAGNSHSLSVPAPILASGSAPSGAIWRRRQGRWAFAAAITATLLTATWFWRSGSSDKTLSTPAPLDAPPLIATLRESTGAVWTADGRPIDVGSRIAADDLRMDSGEAEFVFDSGARLILAGPARLALQSPLSVHLEQGKIAAHMPPSAIGFTVHTPTSTFVDQGTEFGVVAEASGASEVHVFQGQVDLRYADPGGSDVLDRTLELADRQARRIEIKGGAGKDVSFSRSRFGNMALRVAEPVEWKTSEGGNGHFYQLVIDDKPITWHEAARVSMASFHRGRRGHLLSITSAQEDKFVIDTLLMETSLRGAWIGMTDTLREKDFRWVTGEPLEFSHWARFPRHQPDNYREAAWHGGEDYGMYADYMGDKQWAWNDLSIDSIHEKVSAYVIEYEPPIASLRNGSMASDPIEWPIADGGNGHFYQFVLALDPTDWKTCRKRARATAHNGVAGDLAALETSPELDFVYDQVVRVCGIREVMIGLNGSLRDNNLHWTNGQPVEGIDVKVPHLPADDVYGVLRWHFDHWEVQTRESSGYPDNWFGYLIEYAVKPTTAEPGSGASTPSVAPTAVEDENTKAPLSPSPTGAL